MHRRRLTVAQAALLLRQAVDRWSEADRAALIDFIAANPEAGDVIPDTGGVRVIYYYLDDTIPLYLLLIYAKAQRENWSAEEKRRAQSLVTALKHAHRRK